jgi:hypothetical protein
MACVANRQRCTLTTRTLGAFAERADALRMVVSALEPRKAKVGTLLAYPDDGPDDGHIGIVTAIGDSDDEGRATQLMWKNAPAQTRGSLA